MCDAGGWVGVSSNCREWLAGLVGWRSDPGHGGYEKSPHRLPTRFSTETLLRILCQGSSFTYTLSGKKRRVPVCGEQEFQRRLSVALKALVSIQSWEQ